MFEQSLDAVLDFVAVFSMALAVNYILKLQKYNANPVMMLFSPLVLYKYLVFLVALVVTFVAVDIVADEVLHDSQLLVYGFEFGLALGSFGIMMITRRLYEQVAHPQKEETKLQIRKEFDEVMRRKMQFEDKNFKEENRRSATDKIHSNILTITDIWLQALLSFAGFVFLVTGHPFMLYDFRI